MSTLPPPMPSAAMPPTMGYPPAPAMAQGMPITATGPGQDYGVVGTVPTGVGVSHFPESTASRLGGQITLGIGVAITLFGILMLGSPLKGIMVLAVGGIIVYLGWKGLKQGLHKDFVCDGYGITIRQAEGKVPKPTTIVPWSKITGTSCSSYTTTSSSGDGPTTTKVNYRYHIVQQGGAVLTIEETGLKKMQDFMQCVAQHTPQLSYHWLPARFTNGAPVLESVGKFSRVSR